MSTDVKNQFNISDVASSIKKDLKQTKEQEPQKQDNKKQETELFLFTGIEGFDSLLKKGIPKGINILIEGNSGSGKTLFSLQMLAHHASQGKKCLYITFEESKDRLISHMKEFGWNPEPLLKEGNLVIKRYLTSEIYYEENRQTATVQAMMAKNSSHLLLDLEPFIIGEEGFKPDLTVIDSLSAIASTFQDKPGGYRFYLERLFRFFEGLGSTNFLIAEPGSMPTPSKCERFLSDGIIVLYNARRGNIRENAIEVLKLRGASHEKKIVALKITDQGVIVYPEQEVFGEIEH
ncbi:MAG: ATPase domain-containing protein [Thermoplasmatota archaeon]